MNDLREEVNLIADEFKSCRKALLAFGDANRQHLILEMIQMHNAVE